MEREELAAVAVPGKAAIGEDGNRPEATPRGLDRACALRRASGPTRVRMKEILRETAGPEPPLPPPRESRWRRSNARIEAELWWTSWALRAGLTKREMMAALGVSKATCKRRLRAVRLRLERELEADAREEALVVEWETRLETLRAGEVPPPLMPERELALMELAESVAEFGEARVLNLLAALEDARAREVGGRGDR